MGHGLVGQMPSPYPAQSLRTTPSAASFSAYESLRFAALAAVSTAA